MCSSDLVYPEKPNETEPNLKLARYVHSTNYLGRDTLLVILEDITLVHEKLKVHEYVYDLDQDTIQEGEVSF